MANAVMRHQQERLTRPNGRHTSKRQFSIFAIRLKIDRSNHLWGRARRTVAQP
jgi:hypothetical protein